MSTGAMCAMRVMLKEDVRDKARKNAESIGVPLSLIVRAFVGRFADDGIIPFEFEAQPNLETQEAMRELQAGGGARCENLEKMYESMGIKR